MYRELLKTVLALQSETYHEWRVFAFIIRFLKKNNIDFHVDDAGSIYAVKGEADLYPCLISHIDTVAEIQSNKTVIELNNCLFAMNKHSMERVDIGGDDLVGVANCLQALLDFDVMKAVFFKEEEVGCNCSYQADVSFFDDVSFGLQYDRKGNSGFVVNACGTELSSFEFQDSISGILYDYGYKFVQGGMTDVMALKEIGVSCNLTNIECGYYNPHSSDSFVVIEEAEHALKMGYEIIKLYGQTEFTKHTVKSEYEYQKEWFSEMEYCIDCNKECSDNNTGLCLACEQHYQYA